MKPKSEIKNQWCLQFKQSLAVRAGVLLLCLAAASSPAQTYAIVHSFCCDRTLGIGPVGSLVQGPDGTLFGTTEHGGYDPTPDYLFGGFGTVFKVKTDGSGYTVLKQFTGDDGADLVSGLVLSGTTLYGTTYSGHTTGGSVGVSTVKGVVFKVNTDGSGFTVIKSFSGGSDGYGPQGELVLSGNTLYGTTMYGGSYGYGTLFKVNTDGSGYAVLKNFPLGSDSFPCGRLLLLGTTLYGTASCSPVYQYVTNYGCVFKINTDGSGYSKLVSFAGGNDGARPIGNLTSSGSMLYGTTFYGGGNGGYSGWGYGTVFKVNMNGTGYTMLKRLTEDASGPSGELVVSGSTLFGTTQTGGSSNGGRVFKINTDGSGFVAFKDFSITNGYKPSGGVILSGTTLYGTTYWGGPESTGPNAPMAGSVFSLSIAPPAVTASPQSQTAETGSSVDFAAHVIGFAPLTNQWFFNGNAITGCTNRVLCLSGVQPTNAGTYSVIVSNIFGAVTSAPVILNVISAVERRPVPAVNLMAQPGSSLGLDYCDALGSTADWKTMATMTLSNTSQFYFDISAPLPSQRFYRAWRSGTLVAPPSLNLPFLVPAITLTGNIGNSLRLDYINAIGPTDAWVTLDTVTLTNTSQFYFDVTAPGQPQRLYRITPNP
jgi:uncharacterized repeat protein (TIGR03803 family)